MTNNAISATHSREFDYSLIKYRDKEAQDVKKYTDLTLKEQRHEKYAQAALIVGGILVMLIPLLFAAVGTVGGVGTFAVYTNINTTMGGLSFALFDVGLSLGVGGGMFAVPGGGAMVVFGILGEDEPGPALESLDDKEKMTEMLFNGSLERLEKARVNTAALYRNGYLSSTERDELKGELEAVQGLRSKQIDLKRSRLREIHSSQGKEAAMTRRKGAEAKRIQKHNAQINKKIKELDRKIEDLEAKWTERRTTLTIFTDIESSEISNTGDL